LVVKFEGENECGQSWKSEDGCEIVVDEGIDELWVMWVWCSVRGIVLGRVFLWWLRVGLRISYLSATSTSRIFDSKPSFLPILIRSRSHLPPTPIPIHLNLTSILKFKSRLWYTFINKKFIFNHTLSSRIFSLLNYL